MSTLSAGYASLHDYHTDFFSLVSTFKDVTGVRLCARFVVGGLDLTRRLFCEDVRRKFGKYGFVLPSGGGFGGGFTQDSAPDRPVCSSVPARVHLRIESFRRRIAGFSSGPPRQSADGPRPQAQH
jgi:hypothetical protein